jgi:1-acyl-sn-glycerol-3-phosphate acyltransferase
MKNIEKIFLFTPLILQTAIWPITRPLFRFFLHLKVEGLENLEKLSPGVIFAANHTSELDPVLVPASLPFLSKFMPMFYTSRPKDFYKTSGWRQILYGGTLFKLWGAHSVISGYKDYGISLSRHIHIVQRGHSLLIFPEGKTTRTGNVMIEEARGGVTFLAEKTELPIVPILLTDLYKMGFWDFVLRKRFVRVIFGRPLYARDLVLKNDHDPEINYYKETSKNILKIVSELSKVKTYNY